MASRRPALSDAVNMLKQTFSGWMEDNALRLSAALSYYSIFSIAPLVVIAIAIAGRFFGDEAAQGLLGDQLRGLLGHQTAEGVQSMVQSASKPASSITAGILGAIALLAGASGVFGQLKDALNTVWEVKLKSGQGIKGFIRDRILSFGMVVVIGFLLLVSLFMTTALSAVGKHFQGMIPGSEAAITFLTSLVSFGVVVVLFAAIFKVLPDAQVKWSDVWVGAGVTALLFEVGKLLLAIYLGRESTASSYGAAGSAVLVLLWVYYASLILFFGAEFTKVYAEWHGSKILPAANAEPVTREARAQQGLAATSDLPREPEFPSATVPHRESLSATFGIRGTEEPFIANERSGEGKKVALMAFGALAGGYVVGIISRRAEPMLLSPTEEITHGSKALMAAGVAAAATYLSKAWAKGRKSFDRTASQVEARTQSVREDLKRAVASVKS